MRSSNHDLTTAPPPQRRTRLSRRLLSACLPYTGSNTIIVMLFDLLFLLVFLAFHVAAGFLGLPKKAAAPAQGVADPAWMHACVVQGFPRYGRTIGVECAERGSLRC